MLRPVAEFGLVKVWNVLPSAFVHAESVVAFQSTLTAAAKHSPGLLSTEIADATCARALCFTLFIGAG